jgi:integrase
VRASRTYALRILDGTDAAGSPWVTHASHSLACRCDAGLPRIRYHDLRHTHATLLLTAGVPLKVVSESSVTRRRRSR